jgi:hypothetical protein
VAPLGFSKKSGIATLIIRTQPKQLWLIKRGIRSRPERLECSLSDIIDITHPNPSGGQGRADWDTLTHWRSTLNEKENQ